ncbi:conserved hypothetical protein [Sulfurovum sp. enrichment culture clone C5]|uniref:Uncharacterized protein n=1 Tax=Sulfurovum sp. enrichment culture clone C5 TaxID=497650 RepID=A0A0S4XQV9_9BACT|nr:conserved hypothetical protein [Sulfurovum sp. enrichment culture clone C5]
MVEIIENLKNGTLVPFLGMGVFKGVVAKDGSTIPHDSDSMILALNGGRAMSPRLMYEYSRAAMSLEQRKGRNFLVEMVNHIYTKEYELPIIYKLLRYIQPPFLIDTNLDNSGCKVYEGFEHFMIVGVSRIMGGYDRFIVYEYDVESNSYKVVDKSILNASKPILFKPLGSTIPEKNFIISDADFVDWLTEAMGGFAMPTFLKTYKENKSYLFLGIDFNRDTYRMVANELTLGLEGGIIVEPKSQLSKKEISFIKKHDLDINTQEIQDFVEALLCEVN